MVDLCPGERAAWALLVASAVATVLSCNQVSGLEGFTLRDEDGQSPDGGGEVICTKYVSASGTLGGYDAFTSIQAGVDTLQPGETLCLGSGTYFEAVTIRNSGTPDQPITVTAYPGASPVIDGAGVQAGDWAAAIEMEGDYLRVMGFEVRNASWTNGRGVWMLGQHNTVSHMNVHHAQVDGILAQGDHSVVENCRAWQNGQVSTPGDGVSAGRDEAGDGITVDAILRGNVVYNNWGEGLATYEAKGTVVEDNTVYDNWAGNVLVSDASDVIVRRNLIYTTPDSGMGSSQIRSGLTLTDLESDGPRSYNNTVVNNLIFEASLCAFCWTEVDGAGLDGALIANNTLYNSALETGTINSNSRVVNNVVQAVDKVADAPTKDGLTFANNLWSHGPPSNAVGPGDVIGDPLFAKAGSSGPGELTGAWFRLLEASPAVDKGADVSEVTDDYFGTQRPVGAAFDIGAHELAK
jgi:parallel beta-helix repeat protein